MIHKIFAVFDTKAEAYLQPFFTPTKGIAIRSFTDCVNNEKHEFSKYPADYVLFELGSFDDSNGLFTPLPAPLNVGVGVEFVKPDVRKAA